VDVLVEKAVAELQQWGIEMLLSSRV
jgi:hypothetical protein